MDPIEDLKKEHDAVRMTLRILNAICNRFETAGTGFDTGHLDQLLTFFSVFVDKCHHGKEEQYLFPALEAAGVGNQGGPIELMLREHQQGRELVAAMRAAVSGLTAGDRAAASEFAKNAREYIQLLDQHIDKENNVLFPLAGQRLETGTLERLSEGFESIETDKIGPGKHDEFHRMIEKLAAAYLG